MTRTPRPGYTLLEMLVVLGLVVILAAAISPTLTAFSGNSRQRAAADLLMNRLAGARYRAIEEGKAYRLAIHQDGTRVRLAPDGDDFAQLKADTPAQFLSKVTEDKLEQVSAGIMADPDAPAPTGDSGSWITVATYNPDGTCRETTRTVVGIHQGNYPPIHVTVHGVTGGVRIATATPGAKK